MLAAHGARSAAKRGLSGRKEARKPGSTEAQWHSERRSIGRVGRRGEVLRQDSSIECKEVNIVDIANQSKGVQLLE